jgi:hypothetical protein
LSTRFEPSNRLQRLVCAALALILSPAWLLGSVIAVRPHAVGDVDDRASSSDVQSGPAPDDRE